MNNLFTYLLLLFTILVSCSKEKGGKTVANGLVQDETTLDPIPSANVSLIRQERDCSSCPITVEQTTKSSPEGGFNFNFDADANYEYRVKATKSSYFENIGTTVVELKLGEGNTPVIKLQPEAYLTLLIKNTSPFNSNDIISITGGGSYVGMGIDTSETILVLGNKSNIIRWSVTKNSTTTNHSDFIACPSFSNSSYTINY